MCWRAKILGLWLSFAGVFCGRWWRYACAASPQSASGTRTPHTHNSASTSPHTRGSRIGRLILSLLSRSPLPHPPCVSLNPVFNLHFLEAESHVGRVCWTEPSALDQKDLLLGREGMAMVARGPHCAMSRFFALRHGARNRQFLAHTPVRPALCYALFPHLFFPRSHPSPSPHSTP